MTFPTMKHLGPCESEVLLKKDESIFDGDASELLGGPKEMMVQSCVLRSIFRGEVVASNGLKNLSHPKM